MTLAQAAVAIRPDDGHRRRLVRGTVSAWTLVTGVVVSVVVYLSSGPLDDPDVWWHVRLGRLILATHHIPRHETWSYAAIGHAWTPTAWLSDVLYGSLVDAFGYRSLIVLKLIVCVGACLAVLYLLRRTRASSAAIAVAFALTLLPLTFFLRERPQAFSLLFVAWLAVQSEQVRRGEAVRVVPFLAVQWLWANVHGMWILGPTFLLVAAIGDLANGRPAARDRFRRHLLVAVTALALAAVTPVGPQLLLQPFRVHSAAHAITEWLPTVLWQRSLAPYLVTLALLAFAAAQRRHRLPWSEALWLVAVVGFSLVASRNVAPAMILLAAPLARAVDELGQIPARVRVTLVAPAAVALVGISFAAAGAATESAVAASEPTRLVSELGALPAPRHVLNDYTVGGLISGLQPRASVGIDGRTDNYSPAYVAAYTNALRLQGDWQRMIASLNPDCALLPFGVPITHVLLVEYHWTRVDTEAGYTLLERGRQGLVMLPTSPSQPAS